MAGTVEFKQLTADIFLQMWLVLEQQDLKD